MKLFVAIPMIAVSIALAGCQRHDQQSFVVEDSQELHAAILQNYWAEHTENATACNASIHPYHFHKASAQLNNLGSYEVSVLARGAQYGPLSIYLGRGDASDDLYSARTNALVEALVAAGAKRDAVHIHNDLAGGNGMDTDRVIFNESREADQLKPVYGAPSEAGNASSM